MLYLQQIDMTKSFQLGQYQPHYQFLHTEYFGHFVSLVQVPQLDLTLDLDYRATTGSIDQL